MEPISKHNDEVARENEALRIKLAEAENKLAEAEELIRAIQSGDVDAVVVSGEQGDQIFTLKGAEYAYRALVEAMNEGAATLGADGTVLYCNQRLSDIIGIPLEQVIGKPSTQLFTASARNTFQTLLAHALNTGAAKAELELHARDDRHVPAYISLREMNADDPTALCMVVTDLTERKKSDEFIAAGRLASSILESAAEAIAVCDESGNIIMVNAALEQLCGFNPLFQKFESALPLEVRSGLDAPFQQLSIAAALSGTGPRIREVRFSRKDGRSFSLLLSSGLIKGASGVAGCVLTMMDITERRRAEDESQKNREWLRVTLNSIGDAVLASDVDGRVTFFNPVAAALTGWKSEEAVGQPSRTVLQIFNEQTRVPAEDIIARVLREGHSVALANHTSLRARDGREIPIEDSAAPIRDSAGNVVGVVLVFHEVAEKRRAEEELRQSESRFRAFFETGAVGTAELDVNGRFVHVNERLCQITGYSREELLGMKSTELAHPDDSEHDKEELRLYLQGGSLVYNKEKRYVQKNGNPVWVQVSAAMVKGSDGRLLHSAAIIQDIEERKRAEEALLRTEKLASVGRMASTIAHEINNPLETIGHALYLASNDQGTSKEAKSYLDLATQELERVTHITKQTLAFHRENTIATSMNLSEVLESALKLFEPRLRSRGIKVEKHFAEVAPITAVSGEIRQIISNLLSNSMDATPNNGRIRFHITSALMRSGAPAVRFTIADTGSGIQPQRLKKVFEPFFTTKEVVGTGLGLWVTKQIVDKHGATIRVRSQAGHGTVFSIVFPAAAQKPQVC